MRAPLHTAVAPVLLLILMPLLGRAHEADSGWSYPWEWCSSMDCSEIGTGQPEPDPVRSPGRDGSCQTGPWCRSTSRAPLPTAGFMCAGEVGSPEARLSDRMSARHVCGSRARAEPEIRLEGGRDVPFGCMLTSTGAMAVRSQFDAPGVLSPPLLARSGEPLLAASNFGPMLRFVQAARASPAHGTDPRPFTSSVCTSNCTSGARPKLVVSAQSVASQPRAMTMRPIRGVLRRASNVYQRPLKNTSNQAEKSIG